MKDMSLPSTDTSIMGLAVSIAMFSLGSLMGTNQIEVFHEITPILQNLAFLATIVTGTLTSINVIKVLLKKKNG